MTLSRSASDAPAWTPAKVVVVDVNDSFVLSGQPDIEPRYTEALVLVRHDQRPVRLARVPVDNHGSLAAGLSAVVGAGESGRVAGRRSEDSARPGPARRAPRRAAPMPSTVPAAPLPTASVVIPSIFGRLAGLRACVESLLKMDYPHFDIIVVDNRRTPDLRDHDALTAGLDERVRIVHERRPGISAARNRGSHFSTAEIVAFTDDDVVVSRDWLRHLGTIFAASPSVGAVTGSIVPSELETEAQGMFEDFYGGFNRGFRSVVFGTDEAPVGDRLFPYAPGRFGTGANMAFRRHTLSAMGGFDETLGTGTLAKGGEDLAAFITVLLSGAQLAVEPAAYVFHTHRRTHPELVTQVRNYGIGLTAMYTSLVWHDRRHLTAILRRLPRALLEVSRSKNGTVTAVAGAGEMPPELRRAQLVGLALGPAAYLASRGRAAVSGRSRLSPPPAVPEMSS